MPGRTKFIFILVHEECYQSDMNYMHMGVIHLKISTLLNIIVTLSKVLLSRQVYNSIK